MKNKILTFVIGVLVGAIIASAGFLIYNKNHKSSFKPNGAPPQMMQRDGNNLGTPPEKPSGEQGDNNGTSPALPDAQNSNNNEKQNTSNTENNG